MKPENPPRYSFEWQFVPEKTPGDYYVCSMSLNGEKVYEAGARFPTGGPEAYPRTRISYEMEIFEEYTGKFTP
jgi:hypothetical protein